MIGTMSVVYRGSRDPRAGPLLLHACDQLKRQRRVRGRLGDDAALSADVEPDLLSAVAVAQTNAVVRN